MSVAPAPPDAYAVATAATRLTADLVRVLDADPQPEDMRALSRLAADLDAVHEHTAWARDAALHAARQSGATWRRITEDVGIADSTLSQRVDKWKRNRRTPPPPLDRFPLRQVMPADDPATAVNAAMVELHAAFDDAAARIAGMTDYRAALDLAGAMADDLRHMATRAEVARDARAAALHHHTEDDLAGLAAQLETTARRSIRER